MTPEYRINKVSQVKEAVPDAEESECINTLQNFGWDVPATIRSIKLEKLFRYVCRGKYIFVYKSPILG